MTVDGTTLSENLPPPIPITNSTNIPGIVRIEVLEASRIKDNALMGKQSVYVKVKYDKSKARTLSDLGGTAPRWTDKHKNILYMPIKDLHDDLRVEIWNESKNRPNRRIDLVQIPVEPYALSSNQRNVPKWHSLQKSGALLFSVNFEPDTKYAEEYENITRLPSKRATDPTTEQFYHTQSYHDSNDKNEIQYGDQLGIHALGGRFMKYGSCLLTHFQKSKKCLQLSQKPFNAEDNKFTIVGDEDIGSPVKYGSRIKLIFANTKQPVKIGTGWFEFHPIANSNKKVGDIINYGDAIYIQAIYMKAGAKFLGAEGESHHLLDPTIYISSNVSRVTFTVTYPDGLQKKPSLKLSNTLSLKITTFNVWMMPDKITAFADVSPEKNVRAQLIPNALPESDIVVFNEAFCHIARPILLETMKEHGYVYETPIVGHLVGKLQAKFLDSGVVLVSKYPILQTDGLRFGGVCKGDDSLADKGVVYACILKEGRKVHVFASHTQAWTTEVAVKTRQDQFHMMRNFVDEKAIPSNEPVFIVGDFNVNKLLNDENGEYDKMLNILESDAPMEPAGQGASFDAENNPLAADGPSSDGVCERLDFILTCRHHLKAFESIAEIKPIKSKMPWTWDKKGEFHDLSDHYPLTSKFIFKYDN